MVDKDSSEPTSSSRHGGSATFAQLLLLQLSVAAGWMEVNQCTDPMEIGIASPDAQAMRAIALAQREELFDGETISKPGDHPFLWPAVSSRFILPRCIIVLRRAPRQRTPSTASLTRLSARSGLVCRHGWARAPRRNEGSRIPDAGAQSFAANAAAQTAAAAATHSIRAKPTRRTTAEHEAMHRHY